MPIVTYIRLICRRFLRWLLWCCMYIPTNALARSLSLIHTHSTDRHKNGADAQNTI